MFQTTLSQRKKRNTLASGSQTIRLGPDVTSYIYNESCPYSDSLTLCPYSENCFSVASVFEFRGIPIDVSDSTLTTMCTNTSEDGEFTMFETVLYFNMSCTKHLVIPHKNLMLLILVYMRLTLDGNFLNFPME